MHTKFLACLSRRKPGYTRLALILLASLAGLAQAGSLRPGSPDRIVQVFDERGTLLSETTYRNGRKTGPFLSFWPDGGPRVKTFYAEDVIEGEYRAWHPNGQLALRKRYVAGRESGLQQAWTEEGELYLNFEVRNGRHFGLINSRPCLPVPGTL